jgi:ribosomal protein S12 methylthiotransferase
MAPEIDGRILINDGVAPAGAFAEVEVTEAYPSDLVARVVDPPEPVDPAAELPSANRQEAAPCR